MTDELPDVPALRSIDPPANGLAGLRAAIERDDQRRVSRVRWVFAVVPAVAIVLLVLWLRPADERVPPPTPHELTPLADPAISPTFYWVSSSPMPPPVASRPGVVHVAPDQTAPITQLDLR